MTRLTAPLMFSVPSGAGSVHAHGAHVMSWAPAGQDPVLWVSSRAARTRGSAIRGGIPICFPWFGSGRTGDGKPSHGFARVVEWRPLDAPADGAPRSDAPTTVDGLTGCADTPAGSRASPGAERAVARFELTHEHLDPQWRAAFPHGFRALYTVAFGETFTASLTVRNTGAEAFEFEQALHTYLSVGDSRRIGIEGLNGARYHDKVTKRDAVHSGTLRLTGETDRVFATSDEVRVQDPVLGRTLAVTAEGSAATVVWNPWREKAAGMADFGDREWTAMVCVEAANVLDAAVSLAPGQSHTLTQHLAVRPGAQEG